MRIPAIESTENWKNRTEKWNLRNNNISSKGVIIGMMSIYKGILLLQFEHFPFASKNPIMGI